MSLEEINILGVKISITGKGKILEEVRKYLKLGVSDQGSGVRKSVNPLIIFTPNPEIIEFAQKDDNFKETVNTAQINIPDGQGVCFAVKKLHNKKIQRICGVDFMLDLVKLAANERVRIGLIGGKRGVAVKALECLQKTYPGLKGWAEEGPKIEIQNSKFKIQSRKGGTKFKVEDVSGQDTSEVGKAVKTPGRWPKDSFQVERLGISKIINKIIQEQTNMLFVALGHPKQELFINEIGKIISRKDTSEAPPLAGRGGRLIRPSRRSHDSSEVEGLVKPLIMIGVGGAFDYISGRIPRAPLWMRERGLEWLYRLIHEPCRWRRQLAGLRFFLRIFFQ